MQSPCISRRSENIDEALKASAAFRPPLHLALEIDPRHKNTHECITVLFVEVVEGTSGGSEAAYSVNVCPPIGPQQL